MYEDERCRTECIFGGQDDHEILNTRWFQLVVTILLSTMRKVLDVFLVFLLFTFMFGIIGVQVCLVLKGGFKLMKRFVHQQLITCVTGRAICSVVRRQTLVL